MGATLRSKTGLLTILVVLGALLGACSNQSGSSGPSHPAGQTGHADSTGQIRVQVSPHRAAVDVGDRIGLTVLVTNFNGRALEGRHVQLGITNGQPGQIDQVDGFTDVDGKYVTFLLCTADGSPEITAFVEGQTGTATVVCGAGSTVPLPTPPPPSP
ncbi:MAG TPA: hypothetical protein VJB36_08365 [Methylomirabilota bacterium]|nr:hypothetical protein [Methylomirabilota bacterium]